MRNCSRLAQMLHVLLHMARHERPMTSEAIARMLGTNPVVVRRTMAGLRDVGYVGPEKGHGGGWEMRASGGCCGGWWRLGNVRARQAGAAAAAKQQR